MKGRIATARHRVPRKKEKCEKYIRKLFTKNTQRKKVSSEFSSRLKAI